MFSLLKQIQEIRRLLEEKQFSQYARKVQSFFGDVATFLEKLEGGNPVNPPVGAEGDVDAAIAYCEQWKMEASKVGATPDQMGLDPGTIMSIVTAIITVLKFIKERRNKDGGPQV